MTPVKFKECNRGDEALLDDIKKEYRELPALILDTPEAECISKWKLTWRERIRVLFSGTIWQSTCTFRKGIPPSKLSTMRTDVFLIESDAEYAELLNQQN